MPILITPSGNAKESKDKRALTVEHFNFATLTIHVFYACTHLDYFVRCSPSLSGLRDYRAILSYDDNFS